ncbi:ATP-binding cassette domain-containing protein [Pseudoroseomonas wenyumeiae]|uniref:ABC transporter ATP-binding protein n=1 Tax=Teichococcus wenyumeiae TaxID=2478470 RepID=A0A3A9JIL7_9PROT|nr:ABC transporter ATP-binding protein [Pseudoroseomonas wenyumeiae]RKK03566.1 ABC transporter ATP-binding protein [Pseudoroseomonas wenyumeiae]RMI25732.1 ATP-binding cassette domain-containing protein [Pseudoroseomonas wenyumeiae]
MNDMPRLRLSGVTRSFRTEAGELPVLRGADLDLYAGEIVALVAPSGTGKSTLLHLAGLLEKPDGGQVLVNGQDTTGLADKARTGLRGKTIGFVYQFHHLLPEFTALENVVLPQMAIGTARPAAEARAHELLASFGLAGREGHRPGRLSGGEQQRVAISRALANRPGLLLADEPTGNLDVGTSDLVFTELLDAVRNAGVAALIATHNPDLAARMDRVVTLREGHVVPA